MIPPSPPALAEWLLSRLLTCQSRDALLGDLAEDYVQRRARDGAVRARWWYWRQVKASLGPRRQSAERRNSPDSPRSPGKGTDPMQDLLQDLRHARRALRGAPGYVAATIGTMVIGLGIATVMFTVVYGVLGRPLPYPDADELVVLLRGDGGGREPELPMSYPAYEFWRDNARAFEQLAAYDHYTSITLRLGEDPESFPAARVSANYFTMLGVAPLLGRDFRPEEDEVDADTVLVLSHDLWLSRFGGDPGVVGRPVRLSRSMGTVIGVMPPDFRDAHDRPRMWTSMAGETRRPNTNSLYMIGRVRDGVVAEQLAEDTERVQAELFASNDSVTSGTVSPRSLHSWRVGELGTFLGIVGAAVALVLLIVVANLANLALVHTTNRAKELAVRAAIGAGSGRIVRLVVAEAVLLGLAGAALAMVVAGQATSLFLRFAPASIPRQAEIGVDGAMLAFALVGGVAVSVAATLLALVAARRRELAVALRPTGRSASSTAGGHRARGTLAVAQLALSVALLVAVGLLLRSLAGMQAVDTGFVARDALIVEVGAPSSFAAGDERRGFYERMMDGMRAIPGVEAVGAVSFMPFGGWSTTAIRVEGMDIPAEELPAVEIDAASPGFFAAMGSRFVRGRDFSDSDDAGAPYVAIINRSFADRYFPGVDPIGRTLTDDETDDDGPKVLTIIGVVENVSARGVTDPVEPKLYTAYRQSDYWWPFGVTLVLRTAAAPESHVQAIRDILRGIVAEPPVITFTTLEDFLSEEFLDIRFQSVLFGIFALVSVLLASVGLYGVIASGVAQRTHEIGVRMALGADAGRMRKDVLGAGVRLGALGSLAGLPPALLLARAMDSMLFGVSTLDIPTLLGTVVLLNAVCLLACYVPALRASRVTPLQAMRD